MTSTGGALSAAAARSQHSAAICASDGVRADPFDSEENGWPRPHGQNQLRVVDGDLVSHEEVPMRAALVLTKVSSINGEVGGG